jgi:hypothetical protein
MTYLITIEADGGVPHYWSGGEIFSAEREEAAQFMTEIDADATIDILKEHVGVHPSAHVVDADDDG